MKQQAIVSIVKLQIRLSGVREAIQAFKSNRKKALESLTREVQNGLSNTINILLNAEIDVFLGQPEQSDNKRNGYKPEREYVLKGLGAVRVRVPVDRKGQFESSVIPTYERLDPRVRADMAMLHLGGLSTRTLALISRRLLGIDVSKDTVSNSLSLIHDEASAWLSRPITKSYWALYIDGTHFRVQRRGTTESEPSLVVLGVDSDNYRSILAIEPRD